MSNYPIPRAEEIPDAPASLSCRVLVANGQFTPLADATKRAELAPRLEQPTAWQEPKHSNWLSRALASKDPRQRKGRRSSNPRGRPARYGHLLPEIQRLRAEGVPWPEVGERVGINPQAARMVLMTAERTARRREKAQAAHA